MKRFFSALGLGIILAGFAASQAAAAAASWSMTAQSSPPGLIFGGFAPEKPYPGQEVITTLQPTGAAVDLPTGSPAAYTVTYVNTSDGAAGTARCPAACTFIYTPGAPAELHFYAPAQQGTYTLTVSLGTQTLAPASLVVETALPPSVAQLFAGLGLFAAIMAIMALGTEVVIELGKFFLGMKSKVTAMEAFDQLKKELPGQLNQLGVDDATIQKALGTTFQNMGQVLQPGQDWASVYAKIQAGLLGDAFTSLQKMGMLNPQLAVTDAALVQFKGQARVGVQRGLALLKQRLPLPGEALDALQARLLTHVDAAVPGNAAATLQTMLNALQETVLAYEPEWTRDWLLSQAGGLLSQSKNDILAQADANVFQTLEGLGLQEPSIQQLRELFSQKLDSAWQVLQENTNRYADGVKSLLVAVEVQRNDYQSPVRKLWRRLRGSQLPLWGAALALGAVLLGLSLLLRWQWQPFQSRWLGSLVWSALLGAAAWGAAAGLQARFARAGSIPLQAGEPAGGSLGYFLRYVLERGWNSLMGRGAAPEHAQKYGEVDPQLLEELNSLTPQTIASTLLSREEKHQDEETSRIRLLRIISIAVGTYLAYKLQIDAAVYLNFAVPGIAAQVNSVSLHTLLPGVIPDHFTVGIVLTGLSASAGSKFWRDLLGRLEASRGKAEDAAKLVNSIKGMLPDQSGKASG